MSVTSGMSYQSGISTETRYDDQLLSLEKLMTYYKENYNVDIIKNKIEREKSDKKKSWIFGRSKAAAACALCQRLYDGQWVIPDTTQLYTLPHKLNKQIKSSKKMALKELQDKVCINCSKFIELNPFIQIDTTMKVGYPLVQKTLMEHKKLQKLIKNIKCDKVEKLVL